MMPYRKLRAIWRERRMHKTQVFHGTEEEEGMEATVSIALNILENRLLNSAYTDSKFTQG